jgi:hypothetical protein
MLLTPGDFKKSQIDIKVHPSGQLPKVLPLPTMPYPSMPCGQWGGSHSMYPCACVWTNEIV